MLSFTNLRNHFGTFVNDSTATNLTFGDMLINESLRMIYASHAWDFMEKTFDITTAASTQFYDLPHDYEKLVAVEQTNSTTQHVPREVKSRKEWDLLNSSTSDAGDIPEYYFIFNKQIGLYPKSSAGANTLTLTYKKTTPDLNIADYTTGTVDIAPNADETITGSGTTWTSPMAGRWMRITHSDTATASGDGLWYEIASRTSDTVLELVRTYQGTALTTGAAAAYTIGQMPALPEAFHLLPVYHAAMTYFSTKNVDQNRYTYFSVLYRDMFDLLKKSHGRRTTSVSLNRERFATNPNLYPTGVS